jgi:hypothetical protein
MSGFRGIVMPRRRLFLLAVCLLLVLAIGLSLASRIPAVRGQVRRWAESRLTLVVGREVHVERVTLRLWQGRLDLHHVRVAGGQRLADGTLLATDSIHLDWSWTALFHRSLALNQIVLVRPRLTLLTAGISAAPSGGIFLPLLQSRPIALGAWMIEVQKAAIEDGEVVWEANGAKGHLDGLRGSVEWRRTPDGQASVVGTLRASRLLFPPGGTTREVYQISLQADGNTQALTIVSAEALVAGARIAGKGRILDPAGAAQCDLHLALSSPLAALLKSAGVLTQVDGLLAVEGRLEGPWARVAFQGKGSVRLSKPPPTPDPIPFDLRWLDGRLEVETNRAARPGSLQARLVLEPATGAYRARLKVDEADLGGLTGLPALAAQLIGVTVPTEIGGRLTADVDLMGRGTDLTTLRGYGTVRVDDLSVEAGLPSGRLEARLAATTSHLTLETFALDVPGGTVQGKGSLGLRDGRLELPVQADIRSVAAFGRGFGLPLLGGRATIAGRLTGTREAPRFQGRVAWREPRVGMRAFDQIEGDVEWKPRTLRSPRLTVRLGQTVATLQGSVDAPGTTPLRQLDLKRDLVLDLQGRVNPGRTVDLSQFLPTGLEVQGAFRASGRIAGTPQAPTGEVEVTFTPLQTWEEKWQRGEALLRLGPNGLEIARLTLRRGSETVTGGLRIGNDGALQGQLSGANLNLARLAFLAGSQVAGQAALQWDLQGTLQEPRAFGKATASGLFFRNVALGAGVATFTHDRSTFDLNLTLHEGSQQLRLNFGPPPERILRLDLALADADLAPLLRLAEIEALASSQARGTGHILMRGPVGDFAGAEGEATFSALRLRLGGELWEGRGPVELAWRGRTVTLRQARLHARDRDLDIRGALGDGGQADLQVKGQIPLLALSGHLPLMKPAGGTVTADLRVRGSLSAPEYEGVLQLMGGSLSLTGIPAQFRDVQGTAQIEAGRAFIRELRGEIAGGSLRGAGEVSWRGGDWGFQFTFQEDNGRAEQLLAGLYNGKDEVTGTLSLGGSLASRGQGEEGFWPNLEGDLKLVMRDGRIGRQALMTRILSIINIGQLFEGTGLDFAAQGFPYQRLTTDIKIDHGVARTENLLFETRAFNLSAVGQIHLVEETIEMDLAVKPFQNVDRFLSTVPLAGWLLGGKDKSLVTAFYRVAGPLKDPQVTSLPLKSLGRNVFGVFRRLLDIPEAISGP